MKKIVIIAAMDEELEAIQNKFENVEEKKLKDLVYYEGQAKGKEYVLTKCGVGKVNSARVTQMLIDNFDIEYIMNVGIAGSLNDELEIGDIVIGKKLVQHDFDTTAFGHEKGYITGTGKIFKSNENLAKAYNKRKRMNIKYNWNNCNRWHILQAKWMKEKIRTKFKADCVEMEGAAIAQVCTLNKIPFVVIRSISDKPNGENPMDIDKFTKMASKRCADLVLSNW